MKVFVIAPGSLAPKGQELARLTGFELFDPEKGVMEATRALWDRADGLVFLGALPIAVRAVSGLLRDKAQDPAVLCVTEDLSSVLVVAGGHLGGGTDLALRVSQATGADWIPTTATDRRRLMAPDRWARRHGLFLLNKDNLPSAINRLLSSGSLRWWLDPLLPPPPLPKGAEITADPSSAQVLYTIRDLRSQCPGGVFLVPRCLCAGVGFRRDAEEDRIRDGILGALASHPEGPFLRDALLEIGTWEGKEGSQGLSQAARDLGCHVRFFSPQEIRRISKDLNLAESAAKRHLDLPGVAEPCGALMGRPLGKRIVNNQVTVALSLSYVRFRGGLSVVGIGPGHRDHMTLGAARELEECDVIVGYSLYVDLLPKSLREAKLVESYRMGEEEARVIRAVELALGGYRVALVCGGDPVLFGLGALASRHWASASKGQESAPFRIFPGVSAAQGAASLIGPYYTNGLCMVSLSDYLQEWGAVVQAMESASRSGLSVALYNPVSRDKEAKLAEVRRVFHGRTALVCRDISRPGESAEEVLAEDLSPEEVDMRSLIVFPGKCCAKGSDGVWRDMRGYGSETQDPRGGVFHEPGPSKGKTRPMESGGAVLSRPMVGDGKLRLEGLDGIEALILGGTGEGKETAEKLISSGFKVAVSVAFETGLHVVPQGAYPLVGRRSAEDWERVMKGMRGLKVAVDCAHPFAEEARRNFRVAAERLGIPLVRISRPVKVPEGAVPVTSYEEMGKKLLELTNLCDTVFLSFGVRGLRVVVPVLKEAGRLVLARVLPTEESLREAAASGLGPKEIICSWGPMGYDWEVGILRGINAKAAAAKASGDASGVPDKLKACGELGIPLVLLCPPMEDEFLLEKSLKIEKHLDKQKQSILAYLILKVNKHQNKV
ncbi:MAG: precorrin-6A/cobalt-precorrin-6A reductase [Thermanaerothrix sp.]|nr:precorrin-6A/cobalt-precorrin-6A reductase [Thermanaerothrix sp.]